MGKIIIKTQAEFDELPERFEDYTYINIVSSADIWLIVNRTFINAHVVARESSHVVARGSSHVVARESSHVVARESSHVDAWGSSHVVARESSHVDAWGSSHVEARGSSHVVARESSHVVARESSHVVASMNSSIKVQNKTVVIEQVTQQATVICLEQCTIEGFDSTAHVIVCPRVKHDIVSFTGIYRSNLVGKSKMILYKSVNPDTLCDFYTGQIRYEGVVTCPDFDPDPNRQCGGGLHLSPTPDLALSYNNGKVLKCEVSLKDIVVYGEDITKVRCKKVKVIGEV